MRDSFPCPSSLPKHKKTAYSTTSHCYAFYTSTSSSSSSTSTATMTVSTSATHILRHATTFLDELISQPDHRRRVLSAARRRISPSDQNTLRSLTLAAETLETAISTTSSSTRGASLRLAEKILLPSPSTTFSALLFSLIYALCHRPIPATLRLLDLFLIDPTSARSEIAPSIFEDLFLLHLLPSLKLLRDRRSRILASISPDKMPDDEDQSVSVSAVMAFDEVACKGVLSRMSGQQAVELKDLEGDYEEVLDENCRAFAGYLKEVLENMDGNSPPSPPSLVLNGNYEGGGGIKAADRRKKADFRAQERIGIEENQLTNGRYNPIWVEGIRSVEFDSSISRSFSSAKSPPFYPQRVSPDLLTGQPPSGAATSSSSNTDTDAPLSDDHLAYSSSSSSDSEDEKKGNNRKLTLFKTKQSQFPQPKQVISAEPTRSPDPIMDDSDSMLLTGKQTPPKDFVCPITSHIFVDPVTLETGQTYERKAIQEWIDRGNSTCPITRHQLQSTQLPKTNYVLKRLIASWQEQNPGSKQLQAENQPIKSSTSLGLIKPSTSPTSVITQATTDATIGELRLAISRLCMSEILNESETAVLQIERFWREANMELEIQTALSKPAVINGFVEILFNSVDPRVLRATVFLLSELAFRDKVVIQTLTRVDSDVECVIALFKKGLVEAVVLVYLLNPSWTNLIEMDMINSILSVINKKQEDPLEMCLRPKTVSVLLLGQILRGIDENSISMVAQAVISERAIENVVRSLGADWVDERIAAAGILLRCMEEDGKCRNIIADKAELAPVLESFIGASDGDRFEIVHFLSELVKLNRRTFNEQLLHIIKDEGAFSTMHTLLTYLQTALQDQCPVIAGLLLQLDLLAEPRKMSMYREEAIDALISCLRNSDFPSSQIAAAETIMALQGRFSSSGRSLSRACLLKRAGLRKSYRGRPEQENEIADESAENLEEEKVAEEWERKMAFVLVSHEFGLVFEALAEGLKSRYAELSSACFVSAVWLTHMLNILPDTGIRGAARVCLLKRFISIFKSARDSEDKALAMLALSSFMDDPEGLQDLTFYIKDIMKYLRELKKYSPLASKMLKIFSEGQDTSIDLWNHKELVQVDCSTNGEVLSIISYKDRIFSGHSDGTIKIWKGRGALHLILEMREHSKAVTSLAILQSGEKLYSGSLDKTIRVWSIGDEEIRCIQVHDVKDHVNNLTVANTISCFIPQGTGVKFHSWNGDSKLLNPNKYVRCLALVQGKLYCGCHDSSVQEIDLVSGTLSTIQAGSRKLLGKASPIYAIQIRDGLLYSASSSVDGASVKIWNASTHSMVGSLPSTMEVRSMATSTELIYLGGKAGTVEIWSKEKLSRVGAIQTGTNSKVQCMALDGDGEILVLGTSDGRIQAWGLT